MARCQAKTGAGYRCRAEAMKGKPHCWFHKPPSRYEAHTLGFLSGRLGAANRMSRYHDPAPGRTYRRQRRQKRKSRR